MIRKKAKNLTIEGGLELRIVDEKYAGDAFRTVTENYEHLHQWMPWANEDYSEKTAADYFRHSAIRVESGDGADYSIFLNGKLVGGIGLNNFDTINRSAEIGYWLAADQQGKGIITKACRALLEFVFRELEFNRIAIRCAPGNTRSRAIPERLGFSEEGTLRQAEALHGRFVDLIVYSVLRSEWDILKS